MSAGVGTKSSILLFKAIGKHTHLESVEYMKEDFDFLIYIVSKLAWTKRPLLETRSVHINSVETINVPQAVTSRAHKAVTDFNVASILDVLMNYRCEQSLVLCRE